MKKVLMIVIGSLIAVFIVVYLRYKKWLSEFNYGLSSGVAIMSIGLQKISIRIPVWYYNPTNINMRVSNVKFSVYFKDTKIATIDNPESYIIKAKEKSTYPYIFNISNSALLNYLSKQGSSIDDPNWMRKTQVRLVGTVTAEIGLLKFNKVPVDFTESLKYYVG